MVCKQLGFSDNEQAIAKKQISVSSFWRKCRQ
jgi:hypothetical protein